MSRLEEIKNEYAKEFDYNDWTSFINDQPNYGVENHINNICRRYAKESSQASLNKASEKANLLVTDFLSRNSTKNLNVFFDKSLRGDTERKVEPNKESITNEENIVLL